MKFTRAQRHKIYKECLSDCIKAKKLKQSYFICWTLWNYYGLINTLGLTVKFIDKCDLPELMKLRERDGYVGAWWDDRDYSSRIKALKSCIIKTAPKKR